MSPMVRPALRICDSAAGRHGRPEFLRVVDELPAHELAVPHREDLGRGHRCNRQRHFPVDDGAHGVAICELPADGEPGYHRTCLSCHPPETLRRIEASHRSGEGEVWRQRHGAEIALPRLPRVVVAVHRVQGGHNPSRELGSACLVSIHQDLASGAGFIGTRVPLPLTKQLNVLLILSMGRIAGVTAEQTRERLLLAAADVFGQRGYDGTRVADIAAAAGVSNGALYAHFSSKAELLVAALRTHGRRLLADLFVTELLLVIGRSLPDRSDACGDLVLEGLVAARRDEDVAGPLRDYVGERAQWIADLIRVAQAAGEIDQGLFGDDDEGYGQVLGDGVVKPEKDHDARLAVANCPEHAIELLEES